MVLILLAGPDKGVAGALQDWLALEDAWPGGRLPYHCPAPPPTAWEAVATGGMGCVYRLQKGG